MSDEALIDDYGFAAWRPAAPAQPRLVVLAALLTTLISAGVCVAAILARAPAVVIPLVVMISVGCPIFAGWEVPNAVAALRAKRTGRALATLRRRLDELPETDHPLGF